MDAVLKTSRIVPPEEPTSEKRTQSAMIMSQQEKAQVRKYPTKNGAFDSGSEEFEDEFEDDVSYLSHAPATSHGTYLDGNQDGLEDLEK